jgi:DNA-binding winged helix-turn-helix (wHTH) protein
MVERQRLLTGFRLSEWLVKPEDGSLTSPTSANRLEPLLMELLVFLCSRAGQVVPKQDVLEAVWGGRFVSDETVKGSFYQLRKALGDNPRRPRFVETLPKRGYRILVEPELLAGVPSSEADDLCRKGLAASSEQPTEASLKQARLYFERAIEADPHHAVALAGLARTFVLMVSLGLGRPSELLQRAKVAASQAKELNPNLTEPHLALAVVRFLHDHDFAAAEQDFRRAVAGKPDDALAHIWYARFLSSQDRQGEAVAGARRALEADPLSLTARRELLNTLFGARRYDETIAEARQLLDINPGSPDVHLGLVWIYVLQKKDQEAFESFIAGMKALGVAVPVLQQARETYEAGGMPAILRQWVELLEREAAMGQKNQVDLIVLHALLGDVDRCFELIELVQQTQHPSLYWLPVFPVFDSLRSDPRYSRLLAQLGFHQSS